MNIIELDCMGLKCPRPIIEVAKLARKSSPETMARVISDDLAFESDIGAWCETTGAELVKVEKTETRVVATIRFLNAGKKP